MAESDGSQQGERREQRRDIHALLVVTLVEIEKKSPDEKQQAGAGFDNGARPVFDAAVCENAKNYERADGEAEKLHVAGPGDGVGDLGVGFLAGAVGGGALAGFVDGCVLAGVVDVAAGFVAVAALGAETGAGEMGSRFGAGISAASSIQAGPWVRLPNSSLGLRLMQTRTCRAVSPVAVHGRLTSAQGCVPCTSAVSTLALCAFSVHSSRKRTP